MWRFHRPRPWFVGVVAVGAPLLVGSSLFFLTLSAPQPSGANVRPELMSVNCNSDPTQNPSESTVLQTTGDLPVTLCVNAGAFGAEHPRLIACMTSSGGIVVVPSESTCEELHVAELPDFYHSAVAEFVDLREALDRRISARACTSPKRAADVVEEELSSRGMSWQVDIYGDGSCAEIAYNTPEQSIMIAGFRESG